MEASVKDAAHIADAAFNLPVVTDADLDQVEKFALAFEALAAKMKKKVAEKRAALSKKAA